MSREVRAYSRDERKRLIVYHLAEQIRTGQEDTLTAAELARLMNIRPSTKLRQILAEMVHEKTLTATKQPNAGICGFRMLYTLNHSNEAFWKQRTSKKAAEKTRILKINSRSGIEEVLFQ